MRFTITAAALLAFASSALAQTANFDPITKPVKDEDVDAGSTYEITWEPSDKYPGTVAISLLGGADPTTLVPLGDVATGVDNSAGSYSWAVSSKLGDDVTYGIKISLESDDTIFQYSFPFHIKGSGGSSNSTGTASGTATVTISSKSGHHTKTSSSSTFTTMYPTGNLSTTATAGPTKVTLTSTAGSGSGPTSATSSPSTVPTAGAATVAAGSLAMFGGLVAAVLAL